MKLTAGSLLLLLLLCLLPSAVSFGGQSMTLITEEFPPFNYTKNAQVTGATTRVVKEIARRLKIPDDIQVMPWARGYEQLGSDPNVVLFTTALTDERKSLFHWVGPLYTVRLGFYARKGSPLRIDSLDAAKKVASIATYKNDFREQILESLGFTNLDSSNSPRSNIRKLISGRADLWFFDNVGAPRVAAEAGIDPDAIQELYTCQQHFSYIAISRQTSLSVVRDWQRTLDEMKADGTFWWLTSQWLPANAIMADERQTKKAKPFSLILYTEDSPPSSYVQHGDIKGLSVEIVREILRRIGQPDTISLVPWARGYNLALTEPDTALFSTSRLPQREDLFSWVGPLYRQRWGFYRKKGSGIVIKDLDAAKKVARVGTYHQDAKMQYLQAKGFDNLVPTNKNVSNAAHLMTGNIDLWVSSDLAIPYLAEQAGVPLDQLELAYAFHSIGNFIAFSKNTSGNVVRLWQAVLDEMKSDGSYRRICLKYGYDPG